MTAVPQPGLGLFVRLKLRLIAGSLRGSRGRTVGFGIGVLVALVVAPVGFWGVAALRGWGAVATDAGVLLFTLAMVSWVLLPLLVFGTDETLDPTRLALLPINRRALARGMFVGALVGVGPLTVVVILAGAVVGLSGGWPSILFGVLAVAVEVTLCICGSRALATLFSGLLRSRRGRDLTVILGVGLVLAVEIGNLALQRTLGVGLAGLRDALDGVAAVLRWAPPGMAAHAIGAARVGRYPLATAELAGAALAAGALLWVWTAALGRALETYDSSTQRTRGRARFRWFARVVPGRIRERFGRGVTPAVLGKELRYAWRDPRRKVGWLAMLGVGVVVAFSFGGVTGALHGPLLPVCFAAVVAGLQTANQYGVDGPAIWMNVVALGTARALRAELAGRNLAHAVIAVPFMIVLAVVVSATSGAAPTATIGAIALGCGVYGITLGLCDITSVLLPYAVPQRSAGAFSGPGTGRGCLAGLTSLVTMLSTGVLAVPLILGAVLLGNTPVLWLLAPAYGVAMAALGGRIAGRLGADRLPELLGEVSRVS